MSHPTKEQVEKAVKLWRCEKANECAIKHDCSSSQPHERDVMCHDECHVVFPFCPTCEVCGFRTRRRCEDCANRGEELTCALCHCMSMWEPRT